MGRPPLVLETWGKITRGKTASGSHMATALYRDSDGRTRRMLRTGRSGQNAEDNLKAALRDRLAPESEGITPDTRLSVLAEEWWEEWSTVKDRPINTERRYRGVLDRHVIEGLGGITIREASVSRLDRFLKAKTKSAGYTNAAIARVVLRGMLGLAARHGALRANPVDACATIPKPEREATAWTVEQIAALRERLSAWDAGLDRSGRTRVSDLADPCDFMLGTGCRPGEVLALRWVDVDLKATPPVARIRATVIRDESYKIKIQEHTKGKKVRVLSLPPFVAEMLVRRRESAYTDEVFPSSVGTVRGPDNFRVQWNEAVGNLPLPEAMPKTFRSSVATHIAKHASKDDAQQQLGHSSVTITEKHYFEEGELGPDLTATLELLTSRQGGSGQNSQ